MFHFHKTNTAHRLGLTLGALLGLIHIVWALLIATGFAQPIVMFVHRIHFFSTTMTLQPFSLENAILLILIASGLGYVVGRLAGELWVCIGQKMK